MSMYYSKAAILLLSAVLAPVRSVAAHGDHEHVARGASLPGSWFHEEDHPVHALFRRDISTDGADYPEVGTPTWSSKYPQSSPDVSALPQEWTDALNAAVAAGKIPSYAPSTSTGGNPTYADGLDPTGSEVCSGTYKCRIDGQIWDAPDGTVGISFDDGPVDGSAMLYQFMQENQIKGTHFMIGSNILWYSQDFMTAYETLQNDLAVHTWTHPYMTTLTNEEVLAQLAWTMQIIHDSAGGRLPRFWRPPYGDTDTRVNAIAQEVLGLTCILWNQDTEDWTMSEGKTTLPNVISDLTGWYNGTQSPGLIILEHELTNDTVSAFITTYPFIAANNWKMDSVVMLDGLNKPYQNAEGTTGAVDSVSDILLDTATDSSDSSSTSGSAAAASTTSGSKTTATLSSHAAGATSSGSSSGSGTSASDSSTSDARSLAMGSRHRAVDVALGTLFGLLCVGYFA